MTLEEALLEIEELKDEVKELTSERDELEEEVDDLKKENSDYESDIDRLEEIESLYDGLNEAVAVFRDPSNWNGTHFAPVLNYLQTDSPYDLLK